MLKIKAIVSVTVIIAVSISAAAVVLYSGTWPPVYTVESMSMEHSSTWTSGTINTGDIVFAKSIGNNTDKVVTYVQGRQSNFTSYGDYGNVILFKDPQGRILIHRAMFYLTWNQDIPVVNDANNQSWITVTSNAVILHDVGYKHRNLIVYVSSFTGKDGFITAGDYNVASSPILNTTENAFVAADQNAFGISPVKASKVVGKAFGDVPWFGLLKLNLMKLSGDWPESNQVPQHAYTYLFISIVGIVSIVMFPYTIVIDKLKKNRKK